MKSFSTVYKNEKQAALLERAEIYNQQKIQVVNALKEQLMITGSISELPIHKQNELKRLLLEYWSPKKGINDKGRALLNEGSLTLSKNSTSKDVTRFIINETKKNHEDVIKAFKLNETDAFIDAFKDTIEPLIEKQVSRSSIRDIMWSVVAESIKQGI